MLGHHLMAFRWRADDGPLIGVLGSSLPSSTKKKNVVKVGSPLTKLSGSAHVILLHEIYWGGFQLLSPDLLIMYYDVHVYMKKNTVNY